MEKCVDVPDLTGETQVKLIIALKSGVQESARARVDCHLRVQENIARWNSYRIRRVKQKFEDKKESGDI